MAAENGKERSEGENDSGGDSLGGLLKHSSIYAIAPLAQRLLALVLIRFYTEKLSKAEWGVLSLTDLLLGLLPILIGSSLLAGMSRFYFLQRTASERNAVVTSVLAAVVLSSTAISTVGFLFRERLTTLLFSGATEGSLDAYVSFVTICLAIFPLALVTTVGMEALQIQKRSKTVVKITVGKTLVEASLKLWFLFGLGLGVRGFLLAVLCGEALAAAGLTVWLVRHFGLRVSRALAAPLARYSGPIVPVAMFQLGLHQADKLLIERLGPHRIVEIRDGQEYTEAMAMLGTYSFGYYVPFVLHAALIGSFAKIWQPNIFADQAEDERAARAVRVGTLVILLLALFYAGAALFAREGIHLLTDEAEYFESRLVVPWIAASYLAYGAYTLSQSALMSLLSTRRLAVVNGLALSVNVGLNILLVPRLGIFGAAAATLVSFWVLAATAAWSAARGGIRPFRANRALAGLTLVAAAGVSGWALDERFDVWSPGALVSKTALAALLAGATLALLPSEERRGLLARVRPAP